MAHKEQKTKLSPIEIQKYLKGEDYPTDKQELVDRARDQGAPDQVVQVLEQLPEQTFDSVTDVTKQLGKIV